MSLKSFFENPSFWGIFLALLFGAFWLAFFIRREKSVKEKGISQPES